MLENRALTFAYTKHYIFRDFTLILNPGDGFLLTGANGSGKTTLLNLCSGFLRPQTGFVRLHGRTLESYSAKNRAKNIAMLSAELNNNPLFSTEESIRLGFYAFDLSRKIQNSFLDRIIEELDLSDLLKRNVSELSLGQQRLVALGRFLAQCYPATQPQILLCDEPFNYLDEQNYKNVIEILRALILKQGSGFMIATHDPLEFSQLPFTQHLKIA